MIVAANDVKKRGVKLFDELFDKFSEIIINVRGKNRYVVIDIDRYNKLRELELDRAYKEVMEDVKKGDYHTDVDKHLSKIMDT